MPYAEVIHRKGFEPMMNTPLTTTPWPIWLCGSINAAGAGIATGIAVAQISAEPATHALVAVGAALIVTSLFALMDRGGSAVATMATILALVHLGSAIVYVVAGDALLAATFGALALLTGASFVKMIRTCAIG